MIYRFDDVEVDPAAFTLLKAGSPVHIEPKALQLLIYLIERRDRVVPKAELLDAVWAGTAVTENALTRAVAQIRKTLADDSDAPRYIGTVPTKGYRFVGTIRTADIPAVVVPAPPPLIVRARRKWPIPAMIAIAVPLILFFFAAVLLVHRFKTIKTQEWPPPAPQIAARPFRPSNQLQVFPSFAPDGNSIAYAADVDGTPHIFVAPVTGGAEVQLTSGKDGETQPAWSPDGHWLAFTSARGRGIFVMPARGGEPRRITERGSRPSWSPDSTDLAFQTGEAIDLGWTAYEALPPSSISIVNVATGAITPLTKPNEPAGGHAAPAWRPDGTRLAFTSCDVERCVLYVIARNGTGLNEIVADGRRLTSPVFSNDGRALRYVLSRYDNSLLLSIGLDADAKVVASPVRLRVSDHGVLQHIAMTRDGSRFAWSHVEETSDLFSTPASGGVSTQLTRNTDSRSSFPAWSPDSTKIGYCAVAAGVDSGVWIASRDGTNAKAVIVGPGLKQHAQWSQSGWEVLYSAWRDNEGLSIFSVSLIDGRASVLATLKGKSSAPVLSSDGRSIAFTRTTDDATQVWTSSLDGSGARRVTADKDLARMPVWSRDGTMLVMQVRRDDGAQVAIVPATGGPPRVLTSGGDSLPYSFSPGDREIAFAGRRNGVWNVWAVSVASGAVRPVTKNASTTTWMRTPAWSPDGSTIVYEAGVPRANLWITEPTLSR